MDTARYRRTHSRPPQPARRRPPAALRPLWHVGARRDRDLARARVRRRAQDHRAGPPTNHGSPIPPASTFVSDGGTSPTTIRQHRFRDASLAPRTAAAYLCSSAADPLLERARQEVRAGHRQHLYRKIEEHVAEQAALLPLLYDVRHAVAGSHVHGLRLLGRSPFVDYTEVGKLPAAGTRPRPVTVAKAPEAPCRSRYPPRRRTWPPSQRCSRNHRKCCRPSTRP